jgi:electron transfer flavoprotein alpha subunit
MSKDIFVFVECKDGSARKVSLEQISKAREVAGQFLASAVAVVVGHDVGAVAEDLRAYADRVIVVDDEALKHYRWDTFTSVLEGLFKKYQPYLVFGPATITGKDLFPRLAARLDAAIVSDAVGITVDGGSVKIRKPLYGGRIVSWVAPSEGCTSIITFRPNSFSIEKASGVGGILEEQVAVAVDSRMDVVNVEKTASKKVDLQEADFIICGGRGMKGPEHFQILEEIAEIMGGRVGASRAVVDSKWREYDDQIGKSGKSVSPKLYIGCGVAGALHHTMGMDTAKVIVAINKDTNALIFQCADYGVVDDLFTILPLLKEELKRAKEEM